MEPKRIELPTEFGVGTVNAYLFLEPEPVLVDCGINDAGSRKQLVAGLAAHGVGLTDLRRVVLTHAHVDHFGAAGWVAEESGAEVWIADVGYDWVVATEKRWAERIAYYGEVYLPGLGLSAEWVEKVLMFLGYSAAMSSQVPAGQARSFAAEGEIELGGWQWQVMHVPGHATHQTCFYLAEKGWMISGDMVLAKVPAPVGERPLPGQPRARALPQFLESVARIIDLPVAKVFPGHGEPFGQYREVLTAQLARIEKRKGECVRLLGAGEKTVIDLVEVMYANYPDALRMAGTWMVLGYLDVLVAEGVVEEREKGGVWYYKVIE
ncbi:MAG TPA: MBL fold metallo-hydrolase [Anaerolineae bacterium]|nr:MBL fold metallo-hydrolase [Anaerolineae bacterium]